MLELPCAMLAKGPQCTSAGVPSSVCIVVGCSASISSTVSAPVMPKSSALSGSPDLEKHAIMRPRRARRSLRSVASASTAMISEATVMAKAAGLPSDSPVFLFTSAAPSPMCTCRRKRSFVSVTRRHVMEAGSMSSLTNRSISSGDRSSGLLLWIPSFLKRGSMLFSKVRTPFLSLGQSLFHMKFTLAVCSCKYLVSMAAAKRLFAAVMAWMSPVMCKLNSSIGATCE
mmetsp:Transcript_53710/g.117172  ORF Transcript_53710/g.117172 Transcript_53710/m.117172 type:complete len:228 (+) Transcript_53710:1378-2061(+)